MDKKSSRLPNEIKTNCPELNDAWKRYSDIIINSQILIADTEEDLNWHAFLGHSIDMQGFRAAEFAGVDELSKPADNFRSLKERGVGVAELGKLWEIKDIREHLLYNTKGTGIHTSYQILKDKGGETGKSLSEAFETFPFRKGHKYIQALLQNSAELKSYNYSFRNWLKQQCHKLGINTFPPTDFRQYVSQTGKSVEDSFCKILEETFFMVGPEMAPYMLCDWQLWLWNEGKTQAFDNFKMDAFHSDFVKEVNAKHDLTIPSAKNSFIEWWHEYYPKLPTRLANECIWLYMDDGLFDKINEEGENDGKR